MTRGTVPLHGCTFYQIVKQGLGDTALLYDSLFTAADDKKFHIATTTVCQTAFEIRLIYFVQLMKNILTTGFVTQETDKTEILYCTKFKALKLASTHVSVGHS